ncbi:MAG: cation diffusion facilitator family transporter [Nanoarchaeota archaeon]|nr:cation diffusion facilitator family transporter [Nanoarchaeota archaeon]
MAKIKAEVKKLNIITIIGNICLLIFKLAIGLITNSIAVISDAINSAIDCLTSIIIYICMKVAAKHPDECHPFGHHRAEPIAAIVISVLTTIIGVEIIHKSFSRLFDSQAIHISVYLAAVYLVVILVKGFLFIYTKQVIKITKSEALKAIIVDHRNDMLVSGLIIISFFIAMAGYSKIDPILGILIGIYIIKTGVDIGLQNLKYLMGESPSPRLLATIKKTALGIEGVIGVHDVKAHYIGVMLNVELHIEVNHKISLRKANDIEKRVQKSIEAIDEIERVFVHIDPL